MPYNMGSKRQNNEDLDHRRENLWPIQDIIEVASESDSEEANEDNNHTGELNESYGARNDYPEVPYVVNLEDETVGEGLDGSQDELEEVVEVPPTDRSHLRRLRRWSAGPNDSSRNLRRRRSSDDGDLQIVDERQLSLPEDTNNIGNTGRQVENAYQYPSVNTPIGIFVLNSTRRNTRGATRAHGGRLLPRILPRRNRRPPVRMEGFVDFDTYFLREGIYQSLLDPNFRPNLTNEIDSTIMSRIERDNDRVVDRKIEKEKVYNLKELSLKKEISKDELPGYYNNLMPDKDVCCEICGVILGEGIPTDFKSNHKYDEKFAYYRDKFGVSAPWFCIKECLISDIDLSKRVFAAKCGHVYCGRCVRNIGNRTGRKKKTKEDMSISNLEFSAPRSCIAKNCGRQFKGKKPFIELFF